MHMSLLRGQRVVVTGAASGLGRALARRFAEEGAAAIAVFDVDTAGLEDTRRVVEDVGSRCRASRVDVTDGTEFTAAVDAAAAEFGGLDVVVNNAGVLPPSARLQHVTTEDFRRVLDVNVLGTFHGIRAAIGVMRGAGGGSIINTASVSGLTAWSHAGPYCASKAAVIQLTKVAAVEYAADSIRVNCVCPGTFRSAIHEGLPDEALARIAGKHPLGRLADANEIVGAYVYLASPSASFTTGAAIVVDGGYSAP